MRKRANKKLLNHINNWTIIIKRPKICGFLYVSNRDSDGFTTSWYFIIADDWWIEYRSPRLTDSIFTWEKWISISMDYYTQRWILYSLSDPRYIKSAEFVRVKEIEQKIETLQKQCNYVDRKEKKNLLKEIAELKKERITLLPHHLVSNWDSYLSWSDTNSSDFYIWDEINVFIDPENPDDYVMEI